jgi:acetyl esterase/lipase
MRPSIAPASCRPRASRLAPLLLGALLAWPATGLAQPAESVVYRMPGMDRAFVLANQRFGRGGDVDLHFDAYYSGPERPREPLPAIVFVSGGADVRAWPWYESYGRLAAATGYVGIVPAKRYPRGWEGTQAGHDDTVAFLEYLKAHAEELGVDPDRVCVWVFSAGGRMAAIPLAGAGMHVRALVAYYPVLDASEQVPADAPDRDALLARYSPVHAVANAGPTPRVLLVRAGQDGPVIQQSIARFSAAAIERNLDFRLINFPGGVHGFDGFDSSDASKAVIEGTFRWIAESIGRRAP